MAYVTRQLRVGLDDVPTRGPLGRNAYSWDLNSLFEHAVKIKEN